MAINLVRKPSETPNINNYDDYRMFRYATGGYNGVIEKYGNECDYEVNGNTFKIKSGEIVIDGVQAKIDANGETITINNIPGTQYYSVFCEINLVLIDNQKVQIKSSYDTVDYPTINKGDDLTENETGIARLELYRFTTSSGEISNVIKRFKLITPGQSKNAENATNAVNAQNATKVNNLQIVEGVDGVLRIGENIIPQKKLIWQGKKVISGQAGGTIYTSTTDLFNRKFEIHYVSGDIANLKRTAISRAYFQAIVGDDTSSAIVSSTNSYFRSGAASQINWVEFGLNSFDNKKLDAKAVGSVSASSWTYDTITILLIYEIFD